MLSPERDILEEVLSERLIEEAPLPTIASVKTLIDENFTHQATFIRDPARLKALFCTRRAAKSYSGGLGLFDAALGTPGCSVLYIALTKDSARGIMWKDVLKVINRKHGLGAVFNETRLTATLPNGSVTYLTGVDADEEEMEKLLGQKYRRVVLDEASLYSVDLKKLVYGILKPAVADYRGDIWMCGTSGDLTQGLFFEVTQGMEAGWSLHQWTALDNPYIAQQWQEELDEIDRERPLFKKTNLYRQWYLNEWVIDKNKLVYRYEPGHNDYLTLPHHARGEWQFVLGVDLGYSPDPSAFALLAFHENDPRLYVLESQEELEMDVTDVANRIKWFEGRFPIFKTVIDGSNKQAVKEMQNRHGVALDAADKRGKADFIQIMNAELIQGLIKVQPTHNKALIEQWKKLTWKTEADKIVFPRVEHPNFPNHIPDAVLYPWRFCYNYLSRKAPEPVNLKDPKVYVQHTEKLMEEALERQIQHEKAKESEQDFWEISQLENEGDVLRHYLNKRKGK